MQRFDEQKPHRRQRNLNERAEKLEVQCLPGRLRCICGRGKHKKVTRLTLGDLRSCSLKRANIPDKRDANGVQKSAEAVVMSKLMKGRTGEKSKPKKMDKKQMQKEELRYLERAEAGSDGITRGICTGIKLALDCPLIRKR